MKIKELTSTLRDKLSKYSGFETPPYLDCYMRIHIYHLCSLNGKSMFSSMIIGYDEVLDLLELLGNMEAVAEYIYNKFLERHKEYEKEES